MFLQIINPSFHESLHDFNFYLFSLYDLLVKRPYPVDTRRKLNVHKKFRRRPGRLLNVLYTFNLRPVSMG